MICETNHARNQLDYGLNDVPIHPLTKKRKVATGALKNSGGSQGTCVECITFVGMDKDAGLCLAYVALFAAFSGE